MKALKKQAKDYFEENMSGEPLTQEAVEEALMEFSLITNERHLADIILAKHEDENETHFHEVDRRWIIDAMIEFALKTKN